MTASTVFVPIMGFTQDTSRVTGIEKIWRELRLRSSAETWVLPPQVWNADWKSLAHLIANNAFACVEIVVAAYSWGAGHGFVSLAKELAKYGLKVVCAYLADPVYKSRWMLLSPLSLVNRGPMAPSIKIPRNVAEVVWTRQRRNKPQGHDLVASDSATTDIHEAVVVDAPHAFMDDRQEFRNLVMEAING